MKKKFKPNIRKVILNPEQAVLTCECYDLDTRHITGDFYWPPPGTSHAACYLTKLWIMTHTCHEESGGSRWGRSHLTEASTSSS